MRVLSASSAVCAGVRGATTSGASPACGGDAWRSGISSTQARARAHLAGRGTFAAHTIRVSQEELDPIHKERATAAEIPGQANPRAPLAIVDVVGEGTAAETLLFAGTHFPSNTRFAV